MKSKLYAAVTGIIAGLGIIESIVLGNIFPGDFNTTLFFSSLIATTLLCLIFYGIYSILDYLERLLPQELPQESTDTQEIKTEKPLESIEPIELESEDIWICPNCNAKNSYSNGSECPKCNWEP